MSCARLAKRLIRISTINNLQDYNKSLKKNRAEIVNRSGVVSLRDNAEFNTFLRYIRE